MEKNFGKFQKMGVGVYRKKSLTSEDSFLINIKKIKKKIKCKLFQLKSKGWGWKNNYGDNLAAGLSQIDKKF